MAIRSIAIVTNLVTRRTLYPALRITTAIVAVRILLTDSRVIVAIASTRITTGLILGDAMPIPVAVVTEDRRLGGTWRSALRITVAVVTVRILLTDSRVVVTIASSGARTSLRIGVAIRSVPIVTNLVVRRTLEHRVVIAEAILGVANFVYVTRRIILAKHPALPLRKARLRSVVATLVGVARFRQGVRAIGEAQIEFCITPEVASAFIVRITRA